jgi:hypothetical protein
MRERTLERTLKELECAFAFLVSFSISRQISNFHMSEFESTSLPRRESLCHFKVYDSSDVTHTHTWSSRRRRSDRRRRSRPGDRRGRAPASTRTKGSPARCRRIDARAGFDHRSRVHSRTHSFAPNRIRIESAVSNTARTKLHWSRRYEGRDPIRRKKTRRDGDSRKPRTETSGKGASRRPIAREREGERVNRTNASIIGRVVSISFENDDDLD